MQSVSNHIQTDLNQTAFALNGVQSALNDSQSALNHIEFVLIDPPFASHRYDFILPDSTAGPIGMQSVLDHSEIVSQREHLAYPRKDAA
jgi:16S rRNA G966 N2-methylase RsmD